MTELTHMVQYRRTSGNCDLGWHTMAAFDCKTVAVRYMKECQSGHRDLEYRVRKVVS
jgi:hypothetical protein